MKDTQNIYYLTRKTPLKRRGNTSKNGFLQANFVILSLIPIQYVEFYSQN